MPSENSGKRITKIKKSRNQVVLYFGKFKISLTPQTYASDYYFVDKLLSQDKINKLLFENEVDKAFDASKGLLRKGSQTEYGIRKYLSNKKYNDDVINKTVEILLDKRLIGDKQYIEIYLDYADTKGYGKLKIIDQLKYRGIKEEDINAIKFDDAHELKKALVHKDRLFAKYEKQPLTYKKISIINALKAQGFEYDIALEVTSLLPSPNRNDEMKVLEKDYAKIKNRLSSKYSDDIDDKIFIALKNKGYRKSDIELVMKNRRDYD